ncbi:hypothetical protein, partial [Pseudomonas sp. Kh7]|uniref:hypothetical protein n=1 Tax=Pseudomonas sp. Kh7 TaxID=2093743 RepID=UPI001C49AD7C
LSGGLRCVAGRFADLDRHPLTAWGRQAAHRRQAGPHPDRAAFRPSAILWEPACRRWAAQQPWLLKKGQTRALNSS